MKIILKYRLDEQSVFFHMNITKYSNKNYKESIQVTFCSNYWCYVQYFSLFCCSFHGKEFHKAKQQLFCLPAERHINYHMLGNKKALIHLHRCLRLSHSSVGEEHAVYSNFNQHSQAQLSAGCWNCVSQGYTDAWARLAWPQPQA